MVKSLEIRVLGPFEVVAGGRAVSVSGSKREGLLAMLGLRRGRVAGVDELIDALWGEELPAAPRNALQHHVARLRAALGQEAIVASADGYALPDASVDALRFERLLAEVRLALREGDARAGAESVGLALSLWRGPALHGLTETAWFAAQARRLEALRVDALEERFEAALALGEHREIVSALRATLEESPFRERLWGQLMLALYRSGRQADALDTFQEARRVLSDELGLEPGPELQRLQAAILAHDPAVAAVPIPPRRRGNLPAPVTSFVDREQELARVVASLREQRLVTITGPPGVGKSRLALEAARSLEQEIPGGIWLVDLSRAGSSADVGRLVANALDIDVGDRLELVTAGLSDTRAILLFDGCDRVVEEAARIASTILAACPGVRVLATSREVFHLVGEMRVILAPLALPDVDSTDGSVAVDLFAERARTARAGFELTPDAAQLVGEICRRVDGLPLAIELAAARVNALGLSEIRSSLDRGFALLQSGARPSDESRALETLVAWSYDLLHADEKTLLHELAVHRGGAPLPALSASAAEHGLDETTTTQLVGALVDKSVVTVSFPEGDARYDLLDTVRAYALERLAQGDGLAGARKAHAEYYVSVAESARAELRGPDWLACLRRLQLENDNLWAALDYAREAADPTTAVRLGAAAGWYFALAERVSEGRRFLELALSSTSDDSPLKMKIELLSHLCYLAAEELDLGVAVEAGEDGLRLAATNDAPSEGALVRVALSVALARQGDRKRAAKLVDEARATFEERGDHWGAAAALLVGAQGAAGAGDASTAAALIPGLVLHSEAIGYEAFQVPAALLEAWVAEQRDDKEAAAGAYRRAFELSERVGFADHASFALAGLGSIARARGELPQAEALYRRALSVAEANSEVWAAAHARVGLARVLEARGDPATAETLCRSVIEWAQARRPHQARESLFVALVGDPAEAAELALGTVALAPR
jgi:predicted ATPase/DNA-binding SARP family transcriptional activator